MIVSLVMIVYYSILLRICNDFLLCCDKKGVLALRGIFAFCINPPFLLVISCFDTLICSICPQAKTYLDNSIFKQEFNLLRRYYYANREYDRSRST